MQLELTKKKYWDRFNELGLPVHKQEAFEYVRKQTLPEGRAEPAASGAFFQDGYFNEAQAAPEGCILLPLDKAMKTYGLILQQRFAKELKEESDCFALLNGAALGRGAFLYVPPGVSATLSLRSDFSSKQLMAARLVLFLGKGAKLLLQQQTTGSGFALDHLDATLDANAELIRVDETLLQASSTLFRSIRATLKRDARLKNICYNEGAACLRESYKVALAEEGAEAELSGLARLEGQREAHTHILIEHQAPHARSRQHFKKVLHGESRSSFEGKIYVHPVAQKTEAYQLNQNLLLSDTATAHAKPNLEIFADDVKATHGATFAALGEEDLFYLRSRGLDEKMAKSLLLEGFCRELLDAIPFQEQRERLLARLR